MDHRRRILLDTNQFPGAYETGLYFYAREGVEKGVVSIEKSHLMTILNALKKSGHIFNIEKVDEQGVWIQA